MRHLLQGWSRIQYLSVIAVVALALAGVGFGMLSPQSNSGTDQSPEETMSTPGETPATDAPGAAPSPSTDKPADTSAPESTTTKTEIPQTSSGEQTDPPANSGGNDGSQADNGDDRDNGDGGDDSTIPDNTSTDHAGGPSSSINGSTNPGAT